jgi:hypothetical protein
MKAMALTSVVGFGALLLAAGCYQKSTVENDRGKKLTVTTPKSVSIQRGEPEKITITISREKFSDPVNIRFDDLPKGVTVLDKTTQIAAGETSGTFTLKADDNAPPVKEAVMHVVVSGPDNLSASEPIKITVKEKS